MQIKMTFKNTKPFKEKMLILEKRYPKIRRNTLNDMAFLVRRKVQAELPQEFTLRNSYTSGSIRVNKASDDKRSVAEVGSVQDYMRIQEYGEVEKIKTIPTNEARVNQSEKKVVRTPNRLSQMGTLQKQKNTGSNRQAFIAVMEAWRKNKKKPFIMEVGDKRGIFRLEGFTGKPKQGKKGKLVLMHDLNHKSVSVPAHSWLKNPTDYARRQGIKIFARNFNKFLKK